MLASRPGGCAVFPLPRGARWVTLDPLGAMGAGKRLSSASDHADVGG
jgi:hypothetical protein